MILLLDWVIKMDIVEVQFEYNHSSSFFRNEKQKLKKNMYVIVNTDKGLQYGKVINFFSDVSKLDDVHLSSVVRISTKKDYYQYLENKKMEIEAITTCKEMVRKCGLSMNILDSHYNFDRSQLIFRFIADERVDFRQLARDLGTKFRTRIELRQIGIRDKAKEIGGIGPCGRLLCCSSFLKSFDSVTINMAKNQNVSLNPSKINGVCGRLLCCLRYENDCYTNQKKKFPKIGSMIELTQGTGKVVAVNVVRGSYSVEFENKVRVEVECDEEKK